MNKECNYVDNYDFGESEHRQKNNADFLQFFTYGFSNELIKLKLIHELK